MRKAKSDQKNYLLFLYAVLLLEMVIIAFELAIR